MSVPHPSALLRLVAFMVPSGLALSGLQPLVSAAAGTVGMRWAVGIAAPALIAAGLIFGAGRAFDRGDAVQPPWYSAWILLPGAFFLAGAAAMCIFGALVEMWLITWTMWVLLITGALLWTSALVLVRSASR
jgi:hypothetical protein